MVIYGAAGLTNRAQAQDLLARGAAEHWGLSSLPEIRRVPMEKPCFPDRPELHFNLSHSGGLALCALDGAPVGVDIQMVKRWRPTLPRRVCTQEEQDWLAGQPDFWAAFTRLWALKESRAKENGKGLSALIRAIRIPLPGEGPAELDGLWFRSYAGPGWAAAACGHVPPPEEIVWI